MKNKAWKHHWSPNYLSIIQDGVDTSGDASGIAASVAASSSTSGGIGEGTRTGINWSTGKDAC